MILDKQSPVNSEYHIKAKQKSSSQKRNSGQGTPHQITSKILLIQPYDAYYHTLCFRRFENEWSWKNQEGRFLTASVACKAYSDILRVLTLSVPSYLIFRAGFKFFRWLRHHLKKCNACAFSSLVKRFFFHLERCNFPADMHAFISSPWQWQCYCYRSQPSQYRFCSTGGRGQSKNRGSCFKSRWFYWEFKNRLAWVKISAFGLQTPLSVLVLLSNTVASLSWTRVSEWVSEWVSECVREWVIHSFSQSVSQSVS